MAGKCFKAHGHGCVLMESLKIELVWPESILAILVLVMDIALVGVEGKAPSCVTYAARRGMRRHYA